MAHWQDAQNKSILSLIQVDEASLSTKNREANPWDELGIGKPLTIKLETVYPGGYKTGVFKNSKDMLVTSSIKSPQMSNAGTRAVNQLFENIKPNVPYTPGAGRSGCELIYTTPSFVDDGLSITLEFKLDNIEEGQIESLGNLLQEVGKIPLFAPVTGPLLVGGALISQSAGLINQLFDKKTWLSYDFKLFIEEAGKKTMQAGYYKIVNREDAAEFEDYKVGRLNDNTSILVHKDSKKTYSGDKPYAVVWINGEQKDSWAEFAPMLASSALLEQFYGMEKKGALSNEIKDLMLLGSDSYFYELAKKKQKEMKNLDANSPEYKKIKEKRDAYLNNIQTEIFKSLKS